MLDVAQLPTSLLDSIGYDGDANIRPINESLINATYCLTVGQERYLLKQFFADQSTARARPGLVAIQRKIARFGLAPHPIYLSQQRGVYVEEWIAPSAMPIAVMEESERLAHLAKALYLTHSLPITTSIMDLPTQWMHYCAAARLDEAHPLSKAQQQLHALANECFDMSDDLVFCHNDMALNHIIDHERPIIIDWEYAATGNRYFDIASAITINRLSRPQQRSLFAEYASLSGIDADRIAECVSTVEPLVNVTYKLWYAAITEHIKA